MFAPRYVSEIRDQSVANEFLDLYARLSAFLQQSFDDQGNFKAQPPAGVAPVGSGMEWYTDTPPEGWLLQNGAEYDRVIYRALFNVIGTRYGAGNGTTTFNVPNRKQRFPLGKADAGTGSVLGQTGGAIDHQHAGAGLTTATGVTGSGTTGTGATGTGTTGGGTTGGGTTGGGTTGAGTTGGPIGTPATAIVSQDGGTSTISVASDVHEHSIPGLSIPGLSIPGLSIPGLNIPGLSIPALSVPGLTIPSLALSGNTGTSNPPYIVVNWIIKY